MSDLEMPECFRRSTPKARKPHRCCECRGTIAVGEVYEVASGVWPDGPARFKTCADCARIREVVQKMVNPEDVAICGLMEELTEGDHGEFLREWVACAQRRGAKLPGWLLARIEEKETT